MSLVSIIIPTYKRSARLEKTVKSVLAQTYQNWELLIVDDNDNDEHRKATAEVAEKLKITLGRRLDYIQHPENRGAPAARNTGLSRSRGKYICFLDDDDIYEPEKIAKQVRLFEETRIKRAGLVYCAVKYVNDKGAILRYNMSKKRGDILFEQLVRNISITSAIMFKAEAVLAVGGFRNIICGQEYDLILRILTLGYRADYLDEYLVRVVEHDDDRISMGEKKIKGIQYLYKIKQRYFSRLPKRQIRIIKNVYYLSLFRECVFNCQKGRAIRYLLLAIKERFLNIMNYVELGGIFIPYRHVIKIKSVLHALRHELG